MLQFLLQLVVSTQPRLMSSEISRNVLHAHPLRPPRALDLNLPQTPEASKLSNSVLYTSYTPAPPFQPQSVAVAFIYVFAIAILYTNSELLQRIESTLSKDDISLKAFICGNTDCLVRNNIVFDIGSTYLLSSLRTGVLYQLHEFMLGSLSPRTKFRLGLCLATTWNSLYTVHLQHLPLYGDFLTQTVQSSHHLLTFPISPTLTASTPPSFSAINSAAPLTSFRATSLYSYMNWPVIHLPHFLPLQPLQLW